MTQTTTTIWKGPGLEVRRQVTSNAAITVAPNLSTKICDMVEISLVRVCTGQFPRYVAIARAFSGTQVAKIERNPERWARSIVRQRLQSARNKALRRHNAVVAATQAEDRMIALAAPLGIHPGSNQEVEP